MMRPTLLPLVVAAAIAACDSAPTAAVDTSTSAERASSSTVIVTRVADGVRVENRSSERLGYAVWNPHWLGLLGACATEPGCPVLAPGQSATVREADIAGTVGALSEAIAYWWPIRADGSGKLVPGEITAVTVRLR